MNEKSREQKLRLALVGARGRLGSIIATLASSSENFSEVVVVERGDEIATKIQNCDCVIDVSHADAMEKICAACVAARKPLVIGTTGHSRAQSELMENAARSIAILRSANFSIGVNALFFLTRRVAKILRNEFEVGISETHHVRKKDAPSGTAKTLAEILRAEGMADAPIESIREGEVIGEHTIVFSGPQERLELKHSAESREIFAQGALVAARWLAEKSPGLYQMEDVLGLLA